MPPALAASGCTVACFVLAVTYFRIAKGDRFLQWASGTFGALGVTLLVMILQGTLPVD